MYPDLHAVRSTLKAPSTSLEYDQTSSTDDIELAPFIPVVDGTESPSKLGDQVSSPSRSFTFHASRSSTGAKTSSRSPSSAATMVGSEGETKAPLDTLESEEPRVKERGRGCLALTDSKGPSTAHSTPRPWLWDGPLYTVNKIILDTWICEIVATLFSSACIAAIAILVYAYDQEPIPSFFSGVTLNTIVSILSTSARSAIVLTVSTSIGQLKWCRYRASAKSIRDLQIIDDASRGPLGAGNMLALRTGGLLAAIGGVVTLLMVGFSPMFQQLLAYPTRHPRRLTKEAGVLQNLNYTVNPYAPSFSTAVLAGLYGDVDSFNRNPTCPTAHCEWDNYKSVEWCSKCDDVTAEAALENCDWDHEYLDNIKLDPSKPPLSLCNVTLGKGNSISMVQVGNTTSAEPDFPPIEQRLSREAIWTISQLEANDDHLRNILVRSVGEHPINERFPEVYSGVESPVLVVGYVVLNDTLAYGDFPETAISEVTQCLVTLCDKEYSISLKDGIPYIHLVSTNYGSMFQWAPSGNSSKLYGEVGWRPGETDVALSSVSDEGNVWLNPDERAFWPVHSYAESISPQLNGNISSWAYHSPSGHAVEDQSERHSYSNNPSIIGLLASRDLRTRFEGLAASLTRYGLDQSNHSVAGYAYYDEIYLQVRWGWIALPVLLQVSTVALLIATILYSRRIGAPIWKSSLLANWYHSLREPRADVDQAVNRLSDMTEIASTTAVELSRGDHGNGHTFRRASMKTNKAKK